MAKKKRPNKAPAQPPHVMQGDVFRTFLYEAQSIGNECTARRAFDADVIEYLKEKGLLEDWTAWREARKPKA